MLEMEARASCVQLPLDVAGEVLSDLLHPSPAERALDSVISLPSLTVTPP